MKKVFIPILILLYSFSLQCQIKKALFVGNSYTYYNGLPQLVANMATSTGNTLIYESNAISGYSLKSHFTNTVTSDLIRKGYWNYVVLQEYSQYPSEPLTYVNANVYPYAHKLDSMINLYNINAETVFYMTWGRKNGDASRCSRLPEVCTYIGMDNLTRERYMVMASANHAVVSPVGAVWRYIRENYPSIELYNTDESHPSVAGSYAAACCFYTVFFRKDPALITFNHTLNATDAANIRNAAKVVVFNNLMTWHIGEYDTDIQPPSVPTALTSCNLSETSFTLNWNASTDNIGVTGYDVYQNNSWKMSVTNTFAVINNLNAYTTYAMKVAAKDAAGNSSNASTVLYVTTPDIHPPSSPSALTSNDLKETSFILQWNAATDNVGVTGYNVYQDGAWITFVAEPFVCIQNLKAFTAYAMTVKAKDAAGNTSPSSDILFVTTPDTHSPSSPSALTSNDLTETSFKLQWNASTDNIGVTGYDVYQDDAWITFVNEPFICINNLKAFTTYAMTVKAKDAAGNTSSSGDTLFITTPDIHPPAIPSGLASDSISETGFTMRWLASTDNVGVAGYDVYRDDSWITFVTDTIACIQGLKAFTTYAMTLIAKDVAGNVSGTGETLFVTTPDVHAPSIPSQLTLTNLTDSCISVCWAASTDNVGIAEYDIYLDTLLINYVTDTLVDITNLKAFTTFDIAVKAKDVAGNTSPACIALRVKTTDTHAPSVPTGLTTDNLTDAGFTLKWIPSTDNARIASYHVYQDSTWIQSVSDTLIDITGLESSADYVMMVKAKDHAGNISPASKALVVTTPDTQAPTVPTGFAIDHLTEGGFTMRWIASMDNVGVTGYDIYQDGLWVSSVMDAYVNITGLTASTTYAMTVSARDTAGNASDVSLPVVVTTLFTHLALTPSDSVLIYPNPVSVNEFYIEFGWINFQQAKIEMIDCNGKVLFEQRTDSNNPVVTISTVNLLRGIYILRICCDNTVINRKILIHKN